EGKTMIFVSHSLGQMKKFCQKILWIEYGQVKEYGPVNEVLPKYETFLEKWQRMKKKERKRYKNAVMLNQQMLLKGEGQRNNVNINDIIDKDKNKEVYKEKAVSMLVRINSNETQIYEKHKNITKYKTAKKSKNKTYYIKRKSI